MKVYKRDIVNGVHQVQPKAQPKAQFPKHLLQVYDFKKVRCGANGDGGYVIGDIGGYDCYISAGISNEESFSRDFIAKYNMTNNYGFDGTINDYPYQYTKNITFVKKNISNVNTDKTTNLLGLIHKYNNIFLKMDIEGGEYPWLLAMGDEQLQKFKQITIEFHGITDDSWGCKYTDKLKCLEKLAKTHYIIHAHGNNFAKVDGVPMVIELTYLNKKWLNNPTPNKQPLPSELDFPNAGGKDIDLNMYPFVN